MGKTAVSRDKAAARKNAKYAFLDYLFSSDD